MQQSPRGYGILLPRPNNYNAFDVPAAVYVRAIWSGTEQGYTLGEYRAEYSGEAHSLELAPQLEGSEPSWRLPAGSPLSGAGDPAVYDSLESVNIGHLPTP